MTPRRAMRGAPHASGRWRVGLLRAGRRRWARGRAEAGFLLPLSFGAALVLMLSSLSVQTAALQGTTLTAAELRSRQLEDSLASAAEQVAGQLSGRHACLLRLAFTAWPASGCGTGAEAVLLSNGTVGEVAYRITSWQPAPGTAGGAAAPTGPGVLRLELVAQGTQRQYALALAPVTPAPPTEPGRLQVVGVRGMGR
jgi:hypothetical protein